MIRRLATRVSWLLAAAGIALGTAGLAGGIDHPATAGGRGELTSIADRAIAPGLDAATVDLERLAGDVGALGELGRTALAALVRRDTTALQGAIDAGRAQIATIRAASAALHATLVSLPGIGPGMRGRLGVESLARHALILAALPAVDGLEESWTRLAAASIPAIELTTHLLDHDTVAGQAVRFGSAGQYAKALSTLTKAEAELVAARKIRDRLATSVDVGTLDDWIGRNVAYDAAVRELWQAMVTSRGRVTPAVRAAAKREQAAKLLLPPDARALVVILGDVARGGLNQAVIEIEQARAPLNDAVAAVLALGESEEGAPTPAASPPATSPITPAASPAMPTPTASRAPGSAAPTP